MKKIIKFGILPVLILLIVGVLVFALLYSFNVNKPASKESHDIHFEVKEGQSVKKIGENLEDKDLIRSQFWFEMYVWLNGKSEEFQTGDYILNTRNSIAETVKILTQGQTREGRSRGETEVKLIEGWTAQKMGEAFEEKGMFSQEKWLDAVGRPKFNYENNEGKHPEPVDYSREFEFLKNKPERVGLEGYLFPDTYRFYKSTAPKTVAWKMLNNLDKKLTSKMLKDIEKQGRTVHDVLTMASIVQKEVSGVEDMKIVSGILWSKYKRGEKLRSCATLAYILGEEKVQYSREDTEVRSPYNTYAVKGLPPGPISNPGLKAIKAAIYPKYTNYNFFLSPPDSDKTIYSKTFREHKKNKQKYLE